jgi:hypothetical protein
MLVYRALLVHYVKYFILKEKSPANENWQAMILPQLGLPKSFIWLRLNH